MSSDTSSPVTTLQGKSVAPEFQGLYSSHHKVLIIGGGSAGITMAAMLARKMDEPDVAVIEPAESHYYQPIWTLIGAGVAPKESSRKPMAEVIPPHVTWIREAASTFRPEQNLVITQSGRSYSYEYLIVAPGIQLNWDLVPGLAESLGTHGVTSNYSYRHTEYTFECIRNLRSGTAIFTQPATPIKCGGAPQKIMYLASDYWRKHGLLDKIDVRFNSAGGVIFGLPEFAAALNKVIERYGIETNFLHNLVAIRPEAREADFDVLKDGKPVDRKTFSYDMLHVTPPMSAPDFVRNSPLANEAGWVDVDKGTLRHTRYGNIFSLGDVASTPNAKTGAAVRKQAAVLGRNILQLMRTGELRDPALYNGYGSCPLITGYGKTILAEFDYDNTPTPSFPFNQAKERTSMYLLKKYGIPAIYWRAMLRGHV